MFNTIEIDRDNLTIMGIKFSDLNTLENNINAF
jgi:putative transcriptional regulator